MLDHLGDLLLYLLTALSGLFVARYAFTAPWWRSPEGRFTMAQAAAMFAVWTFLALSVSGNLTPGAKALVRVVIYAPFLFLTSYQWAVLRRAQRLSRRPKRDPDAQ